MLRAESKEAEGAKGFEVLARFNVQSQTLVT